MHLLELFNTIIDKNQIPQEWETGLVIKIHKKGTKKSENNRGITLLPTAYKLFAKIIKNRLLITIKCIYRNTKFRIKFNYGISEPIHINKGVRQGCGLFSSIIFSNDSSYVGFFERFFCCLTFAVCEPSPISVLVTS